MRQHAVAHRHMLVPGLEGRRATKQEGFRRRVPRVGIGGPIVDHLVVIEARQEGARRMRRLEIGIGLVERVAPAVVDQVEAKREVARQRARERTALPIRRNMPVFVDVVAVVHHEVEGFVGDAAPCGVEASLPALASGRREPPLRNRRAGRGQGARAPDRAFGAARAEAVEIVARRFQCADLDVHRMRELGPGGRSAGADDLLHRLV